MNRVRGNNRLGAPGINDEHSYTKGVLSMSDEKKNDVPVAGPGNAVDIAKYVEIAKRVGVVLGLVAASIVGLAAQGVTLPPVLVAIANTLLGILASLGLASSGLHKPTQQQDNPK
jgi:hypothetical protein